MQSMRRPNELKETLWRQVLKGNKMDQELMPFFPVFLLREVRSESRLIESAGFHIASVEEAEPYHYIIIAEQ
jgi:hypothetical protein